MLRVNFKDSASRDAFAERFKLDTKIGETDLDIGWHLLQFAKLDANALDYNELSLLTLGSDAATERDFIVKGDPSIFGAHAQVKQDLGNGFYLVSSADGTTLGDFVDSIEDNTGAMGFLGNVGTITNMDGVGPSPSDPTSPEGQWARIRVASRFRPLLTAFTKHNVTYNSVPELIIMDSGINFDHPEFDYPTLQKENFYSLPVFNGVFKDDVGHGTAVASVACGKNLGVTTNLKLVNVKIGGKDHTATLLEVGMAIDAILERISNNPNLTRVINMSWGIARSAWLDSKVESLLSAGALVVCAAGNQGISVEDISPAGINDVITVGSIDRFDIPSGFNNISPSDAGVTTGHGLSLDLFAPGENLLVAVQYNDSYHLGSGTSFASPIVAGIAVEIAALFPTMVPYDQLKEKVLSTTTEGALLFEDDRFSENQNRLAYLFTVDSNANYKSQELVSYLGVFGGLNEGITIDINSSLNTEEWTNFYGETFTYSIKFVKPEIEALYRKYFDLNTETGQLTINTPKESWEPEEKLRMVEFIGVATSPRVTMETNILFFFDSNPSFQGSLDGDITLALTDVNSISYYTCWGFIK